MRFIPRPSRALLAAAFCAAFLVLVPGESRAASCSAMKAELASLSKGGGGVSAANRQQIARLEQRARANGCRGSATFGRPQRCAGIDAQINRLSASRGGNARRIRQLQRRIARQCNATRQANREDRRRTPARPARLQQTPSGIIIHGTRPDNARDERSSGGGFFARLFGGAAIEEVPRERASPGVERIVPESEHRRAGASGGGSSGSGRGGVIRGGGLVTWCVRLCDGYYFPMTRGTSSSNYGEELAMCRARCPGADVSLYSHRLGSQPESMRSAISGEPYVALPTAFVYRKTYDTDCGCAPTPAMTRVARRAPADEAGTARSTRGTGMVLSGVSRPGADTADGRVRATLLPAGATADGTADGQAVGVRTASLAAAPVIGGIASDADASDVAVALQAYPEGTDSQTPESERAAAYLRKAGKPEEQRPGAERLPSGELSEAEPASAAAKAAPLDLPPPPREDDVPPNAGGPALALADTPDPASPAEPLRTRTIGPRFFAVRTAVDPPVLEDAAVVADPPASAPYVVSE